MGGTAHARAQVTVSAQEAGGGQETVEQEEELPQHQQESPATPGTGGGIVTTAAADTLLVMQLQIQNKHKCCCSIDNTIICVSCVHCKYDAATVTLQQICNCSEDILLCYRDLQTVV